MSNTMMQIVSRAPIIPVLSVARPEYAEPLAIALREGGLPVLEVTLRTSAALEAIDMIRQRVDGVCVGAGTLLNAHDVKRARAAGSEFLVTPGATEALIACCADSDLPYMPGVATATEAIRCLEQGIDLVKFFPAEAMGGAKVLQALAGPLPMMRFCPTGGVSLDNMADYLALPSVACMGGSWIAPPALQAEENWPAIRERATVAAKRAQTLRASMGVNGE